MCVCVCLFQCITSQKFSNATVSKFFQQRKGQASFFYVISLVLPKPVLLKHLLVIILY